MLRKLLSVILVGILLFVASCGNDDEGLDQTSLDLIGVWETEGQVQLNVTISGLTAEELAQFEDVINLFLQGFAQGFFGSVEFKDDLSYTSTFGSETETGTWQVVNEGTTILLTETGATEATEITIKSLTSTALVVSFEEMASEDFNGDGTDDEATIEAELTLNKVN